MNHKLISFLVFLILSINLASAVSVSNIQASTIFPGESTYVSITLENNLDDTVEKLSISLVLDKTPFITIGSSEKSIDELKENRQRNF